MNTEEVGTNAEEADENQKTAKSYSNIVCKANIFLLLTEIMRLNVNGREEILPRRLL